MMTKGRMDQQTTVMQNEAPINQQQQLTEMTEVQNTLHNKQDITPAVTRNADGATYVNIDTMDGVEHGMQRNPDSQSLQKKMNVTPTVIEGPEAHKIVKVTDSNLKEPSTDYTGFIVTISERAPGKGKNTIYRGSKQGDTSLSNDGSTITPGTSSPKSGIGGLVVSMMASVTQDRGFAPDQSLRIFRAKNSQHVFLRKGSKAVCPMSQICGMSKNPIIYLGSRKL
jgi:hypothetical protein